ncbi:hypothetical protein ACFYU5_18885 [Nocardia aobensis]|uniref:Uncharacterized protein n=1 Tax=Nocardia aobensis TaxID=257277 RepID=A0ABW6P5R8_9NOCA
MNLSVADVKEALESYEDEHGEGGWYFWKYEAPDSGVMIPGIGNVRVVDSVGGGEGSGEEMYLIFSVQPEGEKYAWNVKYYRKDGYYASFDGSNWDGGFFEVKKVQRTVTLFEEVRK